jgi:hypothetical protein
MAYAVTAEVACDLCNKKEQANYDGRGILHPRGWYIIDISLSEDHSKHSDGPCPFESTSHVCPTCISRVRRALQPITRLDGEGAVVEAIDRR